MTDEELHSPLNQLQRPRYREGDRLQVASGDLAGWRGEVIRIQTIQTLGATRVWYLYRVAFKSGLIADIDEDNLRPESSSGA